MMAYGEQTTLAERKRRAASRLILGFHGLNVPPEIRTFCKTAQPAGFILFRRNVEEAGQVLELNRELGSLVRTAPPLLSVDQEGGRVRRIRKTDWPPMRWVGNLDDEAVTRRLAASMAEELLALGFNTDWAPVCDVDSNPDNPVIGDRSFSRSPEQCGRQAAAFLKEMQSQGVICCAKHFPGHGDTDLDSHLDLPAVEKEPPDIERCELVPFQHAVAAGVGMVMTAHVVFPAYDEQHPATMSRAIQHGLLRRRLGYGGILVSDDMEMKAVRGRYPLEQQLDLSCRASVDLFLLCSEHGLQLEAYELLVKLQEGDKAHDDLAIDSAKRLKGLQERFLETPSRRPELDRVGAAEHGDLCRWIANRGAQA
jgi:beta-N-acetylhexosaminidase